jgi:hypothetical protein
MANGLLKESGAQHQASDKRLECGVHGALTIHNATVGGDMKERIQGMRESIIRRSQRLQAPENWVGSGTVNIFQMVCDLLHLVQYMDTQLAAHQHGPTPVPADASAFTEDAIKAELMLAKLKPVTL